jgi:UTP:GlnB (protein PII) uridylyltransferase
VQFVAEPGHDLLVVEALDRPGLLLMLTLTLHRAKLNITRSSVTTAGDRARDEFEVSELDGNRLTEARKRELVRTLMASLGSA